MVVFKLGTTINKFRKLCIPMCYLHLVNEEHLLHLLNRMKLKKENKFLQLKIKTHKKIVYTFFYIELKEIKLIDSTLITNIRFLYRRRIEHT